MTKIQTDEVSALEEDEVSALEELAELATIYKEADEQEKEAKKVKDQVKGPMLELMTEVVMEEIPLASKTVKISKEKMTTVYADDFESWKARNYPTWDIQSIQVVEDDYEIEIKENPYFTKYEFTVDASKFGRTISVPSPSFDAERFVSDNPELAELCDTQTLYVPNDVKMSKYMTENPESKDLFEQYVTMGKPSVRMLPITAVKEDE